MVTKHRTQNIYPFNKCFQPSNMSKLSPEQLFLKSVNSDSLIFQVDCKKSIHKNKSERVDPKTSETYQKNIGKIILIKGYKF